MLKLLIEVAGVGLLVTGVAMVAVPAGLIVAGAAIVVAVEVRG